MLDVEVIPRDFELQSFWFAGIMFVYFSTSEWFEAKEEKEKGAVKRRRSSATAIMANGMVDFEKILQQAGSSPLCPNKMLILELSQSKQEGS